jgi:pimeloyl-ACP methyl ester carboxylesterase
MGAIKRCVAAPPAGSAMRVGFVLRQLRHLAITALTVLGAGGLTACGQSRSDAAKAQAAAEVAAKAASGLATRPCNADFTTPAFAALGRTVQCAVFSTPQDRTKPDGMLVTFPVVVLKAMPGAGVKTPVIYLHGGPGGSVIARLATILQQPWARAVFTPDRDWVFFDQRGAGGSMPRLDCGALSLTDAGLSKDSDVVAFKACAEGLAARGVDFAHYNAVAIADDVQDLRRALGYETFDLFGVSYGTRIALAVAQYRPEGLRAMVLDSPYPPEAKGTQELPRITAGLVRHSLREEAGLSRRFDSLLESWVQKPPAGITLDDVGQFLVDTLYDAQGARALPATVKKFLAGDVSAITAFIANRSVYDEAQNIAHFCKEELPFESASRMRAMASTDPVARAVAGPAARYFAACSAINVGAIEPREAMPYRGPAPALLLVAGVDPGCPMEFAEPAARAMANAQLALFEGRTHGLVRASPCAAQMMRAFLDNPATPIERACLTQEPPAL